MSEQNLDITKSTESGVAVSGGIGSATAQGPAGNLSPAASLGFSATAEYGDQVLGVNPTGTPGGILAPEQARRFIDYVWDATVLAKDGKREKNRKVSNQW